MTEDELKVLYMLLVYMYDTNVLTEISHWLVPGFEGCGPGFHQQNMLHDALWLDVSFAGQMHHVYIVYNLQ